MELSQVHTFHYNPTTASGFYLHFFKKQKYIWFPKAFSSRNIFKARIKQKFNISKEKRPPLTQSQI